jgi:hypothetical protein
MKGFIELIENLPPSKTLVKWIVRISITIIVGLYMFFQIKADHIDRLKTIESGQEQFLKELDILKQNQDDIIYTLQDIRQSVATKNDVDNLRYRVDGQFKKLIDHKDQSDKKLLYDLIDVQRKEMYYQPLPEVNNVKPDSISIGIRKR